MIFRLFNKWIINGIDIRGINEKNMVDRKFIYAPATVRINATTNGIEILSLIFGIWISSVMVASIDTDNDSNKGILKIYKIKNVVIKNAKLPSKDLFNSFVLPKPTPTIAAIASAKLIIISAIPAILLSKMMNVSKAPQNTNDAPVNCVDSNDRVIE